MYNIPKGLLKTTQAELGRNFLRSVRNDAPVSIPDLEAKMHELTARVTALQASIDAEGRAPNADEIRMRDDIMNEFDEAERELQARLRLQNQEARLSASAGRMAAPETPGEGADPHAGENMVNSAQNGIPRTLPNTAAAQSSTPRSAANVEVNRPSYYGTGGFHNFGEFALAVFNANPRAGRDVDRRLTVRNAPAQYGSEGVDADGGFAVPPDFRAEIMKKVMGEASIVGYTDQQTTTSKSMTFPTDETTPWQATGGIRVSWVGEGQQIAPSKPALGSNEVKLNKLAALVPVTEELLEDAPAMNSYLGSKVPENMGFALNDAIINGTGTGQPLGILTSPALITVPKAATQTADTIVYENIVKMRGAMHSRGKANGVWLANPMVEEQLSMMAFPGSGTAVPVYLPPNGLAGAPYSTLMGRPIITTEACADTGSVGDLIFADLSQYMTLTRRGIGMRQDVSIHLFFDYDIMTFRFILRFGGKPWWSAPITGKGTRQYSAFVALAERA